MNRKILFLLIMLLVCSCTSMKNNEPVQIYEEPAQTQVPSPEVIPVSVTPTLTSDVQMLGYEQKELSCVTYLEVSWGGGPEQWGDPVQLARSHDKVAPLAFNSQNEIYFSDYVNQRLLKYDGIDPAPVQEIILPAHYFSAPKHETVHKPSLAIAISQSSIIIPYGTDRIGLLSLNGQEIKDIQLPYQFNFMAPVWQPVWIDSRGGLLLNGVKVVYFDAGWEDGNWNEVSSGIDFVRSPFWWDGYIGGESGVQPKLYKYKYESSTDFLKEPIEINTGWGVGKHLIGIDQDGWLYFETKSVSEYNLGRYSLQSGDKQFGIVRNVIASNIIQAGISPNGTIYLIWYDPVEQSIQPKMIRCSFPKY